MVSWIKSHKLVSFLVLLVVYLIWKNNQTVIPFTNTAYRSNIALPKSGGGALMEAAPISDAMISQDYAPAPDTKSRMVVTNTYLSFVVDNVRQVVPKILSYAQSQGGYMVENSLDNPQETPSATITVRIPSKNLDTALEYFRGLALKVVSENINGQDVTDQYVDIDARLATLNKTKTKFESILDQAVKVQDILEVQRELVNLQSQIDALKGQQQYLAKNAEMAKVTIYLSTDEIALPYAPKETWRPNVIFKLAVRSLVTHIRELGSTLIWVSVYGVIWIPLLIIILILKKRFGKKKYFN